MPKLFIYPAHDSAEFIEIDSGRIVDRLMRHFGREFPKTARLYNGDVCQENEISIPRDAADVDALDSLAGPVRCVVFPAGPANVIGALAGLFRETYLYRYWKGARGGKSGEFQQGLQGNIASAQNEQLEIGQRIPEVFGEKWVYPRILGEHREFGAIGEERQIVDLVLGVGSYAVSASDIFDDTQRLQDLTDSGVAIYAPGYIPGTDAAQVLAGVELAAQAPAVYRRCSAVTGQALDPGGADFSGVISCYYWYFMRAGSSIFVKIPKSGYNIYNAFSGLSSGDGFTLCPSGGVSYRIDIDAPGLTYLLVYETECSVVSFDESSDPANYIVEFTVANPSSPLNSMDDTQWWYARGTQLPKPSGWTNYIDISVTRVGIKYVGWFDVAGGDDDSVLINAYAPSGLYRSGGGAVESVSVELGVELRAVDSGGAVVASDSVSINIGDGRPNSSDHVGKSLLYSISELGALAPSDRVQFRIYRATDQLSASGYEYVQQVQVIDAYSVKQIASPDYGDVTTVQWQTRATKESLQRQRKLKIRATRCLPEWSGSGDTFGTTLVPTKRADAILAHVFHDPSFMGRPRSEFNAPDVYAVIQEIEDYFGIAEAVEFCHEFTESGQSAEDVIEMIADAIFCNCGRIGSKFRLNFERPQDFPSKIFGPTNIVPGSQARRTTFGGGKYDGVELVWHDPDDEAESRIYLPTDRSARKPLKIQADGVRNEMQAHLLAWRAYQRQRYQHTTVQFKGLPEAGLLPIGEQIHVADTTRGTLVRSGEIVGQVGLKITCTSPVDFVPSSPGSFVIFIQLADGTAWQGGCSHVATDPANVLTLASALPGGITTSPAAYTRATYSITPATAPGRTDAYIISSRKPESGGLHSVEAINYDPRYFEHDLDYYPT